MPRYTYIAKTDPTKTIQGILEAESEQDALNKLNNLGYFPVSVKADDINLGKQRDAWGMRKISNKDIVLTTRQISNLVESGVNIINAINIVSNQTPNKYLREIFNDITYKIKDGKSFSESLAFHPELFPSLYIALVRTGEVGGTIGDTLRRLADFLEKEEEFKSSIGAALIYPFFLLAVSTLTVIVLMGFVIPKLVGMFEDMGQILPLPTRILINTSTIFRHYWWLMLAVIAAIIFSVRRLYSLPQGRLYLDSLKLKTPILGNLVLKSDIGRLMRTMSLLLSGGVSIIYTLEISGSVVANQVLKREVEKFKDNISKGASFSRCLSESIYFPQLVTSIVTVGEETGTLEKSLMRISNDYEKEVDDTLKTMTRMLEPIIILVMGLIVGFIVISMLLPIFQINLIVK